MLSSIVWLALLSLWPGWLWGVAAGLDACLACQCLNNVYGPPYITVSCAVDGPEFFSRLARVSAFPAEPFELALIGYTDFAAGAGRAPATLTLPVDALAPFANSSLCCLGLFGFDRLGPLGRFLFRGLRLQRIKLAGLGMDSLPADALETQSAWLLKVDVFDVVVATAADRGTGTGARAESAGLLPRFNSLEALQSIVVQATPLSPLPNYTFCSLPSLVLLQITDGGLGEDGHFPGAVIYDVPRLETLRLARNGFRRMPAALARLGALRHLDLSDNRIGEIDAEVLRALPGLVRLELGGNRITVVDARAVAALGNLTSLEVLSLGGGNPFLCTCELLAFIRWLHEASVRLGADSKLAKLSCKSPPRLARTRLLSADLLAYLETSCSGLVEGATTDASPPAALTTTMPADLHGPTGRVGDEVSSLYRAVVPVVAVCVLLSLAGVAGTCVLHGRLKRRWVGLFRRFEPARTGRQIPDQEVEAMGTAAYDAYVTHHRDLTEFVANEMIPALEGGPDGLRLCVSFRDFLVGADHLDNVTTAIETSRAVVALLDADFVASGQCLLELSMACSRMLEEGVGSARGAGGARPPPASLLLVLLDALPLESLPVTVRVLQEKITCLQWFPEDADRCWRQLRASLDDVKAAAGQPGQRHGDEDMRQPLIAL